MNLQEAIQQATGDKSEDVRSLLDGLGPLLAGKLSVGRSRVEEIFDAPSQAAAGVGAGGAVETGDGDVVADVIARHVVEVEPTAGAISADTIADLLLEVAADSGIEPPDPPGVDRSAEWDAEVAYEDPDNEI